MKIILADDHSLFRDGIRSMLESEATCYEADCYEQTLSQLKTHPDAKLLLMDLKMPGMDNFKSLIEIRQLYPEIPLIVVSMHCEPEIIQLALSYGISGYIPKTHTFESMQKAIDLVLSGVQYIPQEALSFANSATTEPNRLTKRQKEIYLLLMQGKTNQEIADELYISLSTVKMHVSTVLKNTGAKNRSQLLATKTCLFN
ncbi:MAG: response regulator transcription factor [Candidatus Thiodiazotropha sp.]